MEDIKAYIESGVLELYVLGQLSHDEKLQVEDMAFQHPLVKQELGQIELSLEAYALKNAVEPAKHLKATILANIDAQQSKPDEATEKVVNLLTRNLYDVYKYAFAATLLALIVSLVVLYNLNSRLQQTNAQIALLQSHNEQFASRVNLMDNEIRVFHDPSVKLITLQGLPKSPNAKLTLAWSPQKGKVMIDMGDMKLAQNDDAHQYQLWAIVKGKPVSLGVFDASKDTTGMKEMASVADAAVFAVTVEPRGGSISPTMDAMVVAAKI